MPTISLFHDEENATKQTRKPIKSDATITHKSMQEKSKQKLRKKHRAQQEARIFGTDLTKQVHKIDQEEMDCEMQQGKTWNEQQQSHHYHHEFVWVDELENNVVRFDKYEGIPSLTRPSKTKVIDFVEKYRRHKENQSEFVPFMEE